MDNIFTILPLVMWFDGGDDDDNGNGKDNQDEEDVNLEAGEYFDEQGYEDPAV